MESPGHGWIVERGGDRAPQVWPDADDREHITNGDPCPCMPCEVDGAVVHNSYDGREIGAVLMKLVEVLAEVAGVNHEWTDEQRRAVDQAEAVVALHFPDEL